MLSAWDVVCVASKTLDSGDAAVMPPFKSRESWARARPLAVAACGADKALIGSTWDFVQTTRGLCTRHIQFQEISPVSRRRRHAIILASASNLLHKEVTRCDLQL
jgi:hypothetical protein